MIPTPRYVVFYNGMRKTEYDEELHIRSEKALSYEEGKIEGRMEGETVKLLQLIVKKLKKGKTPEMIAKETEEDLERIQKICTFLEKHNFTDDYEALYRQFCKEKIV